VELDYPTLHVHHFAKRSQPAGARARSGSLKVTLLVIPAASGSLVALLIW
jgi:hypothetical protein